MGAPPKSASDIVVVHGKLNSRKVYRIYNEAYRQITTVWNLLPQSARMSLKGEGVEEESMEVTDCPPSVQKKNQIEDLDKQIDLLRGKCSSYKERTKKKRLKKQLRKKKKSEEKLLLKEEKRLKRKQLAQQKRLTNKRGHDNTEQTRLTDHHSLNKKYNVFKSTPHQQPSDALQHNGNETSQDLDNNLNEGKEEEEDENVGGGLSKKKLKALEKQELLASKKREKRRLVKKKKREQLQEQVQKVEVKEVKPVDADKELEIMYNKLDLTDENSKKKFKRPKFEKDPVKALSKVEELNKKIEELKVSGREEKAASILSRDGWKKAIMKADGVRVKDNVALLKKTIKRQEKKKSKSKSEWKQRVDIKEKRLADAQKKRKENIQKKKKEKKQKKIKKSIKKGRVVI